MTFLIPSNLTPSNLIPAGLKTSTSERSAAERSAIRAAAKTAIFALAIGATVSAAPFFEVSGTHAHAEDAALASIEHAKALSTAFEKVADIITPSVVNVSSSRKSRRGPGTPKGDPFFDQFRDFFGEDFADRFGQQGMGPQGPPQQQGLGTGVIIDSAGHILTNNHVVGDADEVTVRLHDERTFKATVVGKDDRSDLAVIKIKAPNLVPALLGDSDTLKIGQWVVASGNPFGLDNTITAGIVSAKGRSIMGGSQYEDFIQTDAAINPGNSGGPLVDLDGKVVGINTAIFSRSGGYMGIGFAIPMNMARKVMESLISTGKVVRGWLGIGIQNLNEDLAKSFEYSATEGALVGHIEPNGPAAKAKLQQGDIIVTLDGEKIKNINQLRNRVAGIKPGTKVAAEVWRNGKTMNISIEIGQLPSNLPGQEIEEDSDETPAIDIGITVETLTPDLARRLKSSRLAGVVVAKVRPGGLAARAGVAPSDIIISINGKSVGDVTEFRAAMREVNLKKGARLIIESQGMERFVFLREDE
ncbi:MAG: putative periplasmic serine endoprotease DegP-like precursor [Pseudomonadota bacterium]|jgi:serine protease Do